MNYVLRSWLLPLLSLCCLLPTRALADSFNSVRDRVYAKPLRELPELPGLTLAEFGKAIAGMREPISVRSRATLGQQTDFKPPGAKLLHPRGVCAEGLWRVDRASPFTGLFAKGTEVPAMLRFSSGTKDSRFLKSHARLFGMAVKLFPTRDTKQAVVTKNVFTLDQAGFEGSARVSYFGGPGDGPVYFTNYAPAHSAAGKLASSFFSRFDNPDFDRPLYALAEVDQQGRAIASAKVPKEVRFVPVRAAGVPVKADDDFRGEILQYKPGEISFAITVAVDGRFERIGTLNVGAPVVSAVCDLELHFHHHPNNRALEQKR